MLATFVSTPFGVFIYGGGRPGATPTSRLPLCDLWHLKKMLPGVADGADQGLFMWEDCNRMPMCSAEHAVAPDAGPALLRTPVAADRLVVGHDAHAWTFMEPSHIVVGPPTLQDRLCHALLCGAAKLRPSARSVLQ